MNTTVPVAGAAGTTLTPVAGNGCWLDACELKVWVWTASGSPAAGGLGAPVRVGAADTLRALVTIVTVAVGSSTTSRMRTTTKAARPPRIQALPGPAAPIVAGLNGARGGGLATAAPAAAAEGPSGPCDGGAPRVPRPGSQSLGTGAMTPPVGAGVVSTSVGWSIAVPPSKAATVGNTLKPVSIATCWVRGSLLTTAVCLPSELLYCISRRALSPECITREAGGSTKTSSFSDFSERSRSTRLVISSSGSA